MSDEKNKVISGLREALNFSPENVPLRRHLAETFMSFSDYENAEEEFLMALRYSPNDEDSKNGLGRCYIEQGKNAAALVMLEDLYEKNNSSETSILYATVLAKSGSIQDSYNTYRQALDKGAEKDTFLEEKLFHLLQTSGNDHDAPTNSLRQSHHGIEEEENDDAELFKSDINFSNVGGMHKIKEEIRMKIIHPLNNKDLFAAYGKKIGGGIMLYGPPGCGKTHLARATAGEINASFISIALNDILSMWIGKSEEKLHSIFEQARRNTPCVLFFDEVDALAASRSDLKKSGGKNLINQFLSELDGIDGDNEGVLILAATNSPWHLDSAFRRPGRFDRILFVPPPDRDASKQILDILLKGKPCDNVDIEKISKKLKDYSGADLKALIDTVIENKLTEAMKTGIPAPISTKDILRAIPGVRASTREWFSKAKNYALYSNDSGLYDDILEHLKLR